MPKNIDWTNVAAIPVLVLILLVIVYLWSRGVRRGKPLLPIQKKLILYAGLFSLGMGYSIVFTGQLAILFNWQSAWIVVTLLWGVVLGLIAWYRYRREKDIETRGLAQT